MTEETYDYSLKIVIVGNSGVGKSNLLSRFTKNDFSDKNKSTIGVEFAVKKVMINKKIINVEVWDTAGQEKYRAITSVFYRSAIGAIVVYDVTNRKKF